MMDVKVDIMAFRERTADDKDLAMELISCFDGGLMEYKTQMMSFADSCDYESLASILHKLKGAVGIFGFDNIVEYIINFEKSAKQKSIADAHERTEHLFAAIDEHVRELKEVINSNNN